MSLEEIDKKEGFLFDMDGVVLNSMPWHIKAWQEAFALVGIKIPAYILYLHEGAIEARSSKKIFKEQGVEPSPRLFSQILSLQKEIFTQKYRHLVKPFPEIPFLLSRLREKGKKLALVTSSHQDVLEKILPSRIRELFHFVLTGDSVKKRKPHPEPYLKASEELGLSPNKAVAIENAPMGIISARKAGVFCIALTTTLKPQHLKEANLILSNHQTLCKLLINHDFHKRSS